MLSLIWLWRKWRARQGEAFAIEAPDREHGARRQTLEMLLREPAGNWRAPPVPPLTSLLPYLAAVTDRPEPATPRQIEAIANMEFGGDVPPLTMGQAGAILSARRYAEGAIFELLGEMHRYRHERAIEAALAAFIIRDDGLRNRALAWNKRSYARGSAAVPKPKRDEHFMRVLAEARRLLD